MINVMPTLIRSKKLEAALATRTNSAHDANIPRISVGRDADEGKFDILKKGFILGKAAHAMDCNVFYAIVDVASKSDEVFFLIEKSEEDALRKVTAWAQD